MKVTKDFFDKLREEVRSAASNEAPEQKHLSIEDILKGINGYGDSNLDACLKQIDWFAIEPMDLIPREKVRAFAKRILDTDKRRQTLKFLLKYEDYYFKDIQGIVGTEERMGDFGLELVDKIGVTYSISDFDKELRVLIEQIESAGEFSTGKFDRLNAELVGLKNYVKTVEEERNNLRGELEALKKDYEESQSRPRHNDLPDLDAICEYAKTLSREEIRTIQNMLLSLMDITDKEIKKKITSIKPEVAPTQIAMGGDIVNTKIVKK